MRVDLTSRLWTWTTIPVAIVCLALGISLVRSIEQSQQESLIWSDRMAAVRKASSAMWEATEAYQRRDLTGLRRAREEFQESTRGLAEKAPAEWDVPRLLERSEAWTEAAEAAVSGKEARAGAAESLLAEEQRLASEWKLALSRFSGAYVVALSGPLEKWRDAGLLAVLACILSLALVVLQRTYRRRIQERVRDEVALRESEAKFRGLFENVLEGVFQANEDGSILAANPAMGWILGWKPEEDIRSLNLKEHLGMSEEEGQRLLTALANDGYLHNVELVVTTREGQQKTVLGSVRPVRNQSGNVVYYEGSAVDISDRKRAEEAAQRYTQQVEEARRKLEQQARQLLEQSFELAEARDKALQVSQLKSEFLANLSHEFRTPLNGVIAMGQLLLDTELDGQQREFAEMVQRSAAALLTTMNEIVEYSKIEAGHVTFVEEEFSLQDAVKWAIGQTAAQAEGRGLELTCLIRPEVKDRVIGDGRRIGEVLLHLLQNSIELTQSGEVAVTVSLARELADDWLLRFQVEDTGAGFLPESYARLFEPFAQAVGQDGKKAGNGLALAIAKLLVERMGGQVGVESEPGQGSLFWFLVPVQKLKEWRYEEDRAAGVAGKTILVVDDVARARGVAAELVTSWGMRCTTASDAGEALEALGAATANGSGFDVVLADYDMPGRSGLELAEAVVEEAGIGATPIVLMTPYSQREYRDEPLFEGIRCVVSKPVQSRELLDALLECIGPELEEGWRDPAGDLARIEQSVREAGAAGADARAVNGRKRILIAEDNIVNQKVALRLVEKMGYEADVVANGEEAVAAVESKAYDLVLMDCQMPGMDGFECTGQIRRGEGPCAKVPIVAMTANAMHGDRERCLNAGMNDYISKPVSFEDLRALIERWLSESGSMAQRA